RDVHVGGDALEPVSTYAHGRVRKFIHPRFLADLLDGAARGAAAEQYRGRAREYFHRFQIERIAIVTAEVQLTIEIHVVTRGKAPDLNIGTLVVIVIRMCADARIVATHVAYVAGSLKLNDFFRDSGDGLRRIEDRLRQKRQIRSSRAADEKLIEIRVVSKR